MAANSPFDAGMKAYQAGDLRRAEDGFRETLRLDPGHAEAAHGLGVIAFRVGRYYAAIDLIERAIRLAPANPEARRNLCGVLVAAGRAMEAVTAADAALLAMPDNPVVLSARGNALLSLDRHTEAEADYRKAAALAPSAANALEGLGRALTGQLRCEEALPFFQEVVELTPTDTAYHNLGTAYRLLGRLDEAMSCFDAALRIAPQAAMTRVNRATLLLLLGDLQRGWADFEYRWYVPSLSPKQHTGPRWDGGPLGGRTVLLHAEQGIGDTLFFIRYAPLVRAKGGRVMVSAPTRLLPLLSRCPGIDSLADDAQAPPQYDVHAALASLPWLMRTPPEPVPATVPYLYADPERIAYWRQRLAAVPGFKVGVSWRGNPKYPEDRRRSFSPDCLAALASMPGVQLIRLQRREPGEPDATAGIPVLDLGELDAGPTAFHDTAAIMKCLDLVISPDTALAHLAGGLGVPTWLALPRVPDWRWQLQRPDSPWYPTMRLFRQSSDGDWRPVFEAMAKELEGKTQNGCSLSSRR